MSPDPELAWSCEPRNDLTTTSPDADLAVTGQCASVTVTSPEPEAIRAVRPSTRSHRDVAGPGRAVEVSRLPDRDVSRSADDLRLADVGGDRDVGGTGLDHISQASRHGEAKMSRGVAEQLGGKAEPQLIMIMTRLDVGQERLIRGTDRRIHGVGRRSGFDRARFDDDRPAAEVVDDDVPHALVHRIRRGQRTHPWTFPRERRSSSCGRSDRLGATALAEGSVGTEDPVLAEGSVRPEEGSGCVGRHRPSGRPPTAAPRSRRPAHPSPRGSARRWWRCPQRSPDRRPWT